MQLVAIDVSPSYPSGTWHDSQLSHDVEGFAGVIPQHPFITNAASNQAGNLCAFVCDLYCVLIHWELSYLCCHVFGLLLCFTCPGVIQFYITIGLFSLQ